MNQEFTEKNLSPIELKLVAVARAEAARQQIDCFIEAIAEGRYVELTETSIVVDVTTAKEDWKAISAGAKILGYEVTYS